MTKFEKLNEINGFDSKDLINAKQNNYAWSMAELDDYIYVGTGRNIAWISTSVISQNAVAPLLVKTKEMDNTGEIWRYKKDGSLPWQRVFKASSKDNIGGFRYMIAHASKNSSKALYAASFNTGSNGVVVLKSTDGSNWTKVSNNLIGSSSRAMASFNGKLYVSCIGGNGIGDAETPVLYSSEDPEFFDFKLVINKKDPNFIVGKNPNGAITNMEVFNNNLYVCTNGDEGMAVWRTNGNEPKLNDWTCVIDKGFGDAANKHPLATGVFEDHLYIAAIKEFPLLLIFPSGAEIVRVDKKDKWELVVGGEPIVASNPTTGVRGKSLSGYKAGFSNPLNAYIWQLQSFDGMLITTTFDHGSNIETLRDIALLNKNVLVRKIGEDLYNLVIKIYDTILYLFDKYNYPKGFDLYASVDGAHFKPISLNGLGNKWNYGGRMLMVDSNKNLYIGTANPYQGCEIFRTCKDDLVFDIVSHCDVSYANSLFKFVDDIEKMQKTLLKQLKEKGVKLV